MQVKELVQVASEKAGNGKILAELIKRPPSRISEWKAGKRTPDASEIACMAKVAGLPVLITLALVEREIDPDSAQLWEAALGEVNAPPGLLQAGAICALC
jgi:hypothetical protein